MYSSSSLSCPPLFSPLLSSLLTSPPFPFFSLYCWVLQIHHIRPQIQTSDMTGNRFRDLSVNTNALVCVSWLPQFFVAHHLLISAPPPCSSSSPFHPSRYTHSDAPWALIGCGWTARRRVWIWLVEGSKQVVVEQRELQEKGGGRCFFFKDVNSHLSQSAITRLWVQKSRSESERSGLWQQDNVWILMTYSFDFWSFLHRLWIIYVVISL